MTTASRQAFRPAARTAGFAGDLRRGLSSAPRQVAARWLYDDLGSALFEAICHLPWYKVTRAERALLEREAHHLAGECRDVDWLVELGPGSGDKLGQLLSGLRAAGLQPAVHLVDVSPSALALATTTVSRQGVRDVTCDCAEYLDGIDALPRLRQGRGRALVAFLGSNLGNFHWPEAVALLRRLHARLRGDDLVLLGLDLVKPEPVLRLAYDDPLGVTAAFNKNLLARINRELDANFDLHGFAHRIVWDDAARRVEMHLESLRAQRVAIPGADLAVDFARGETIWTESSYKFDLAHVEALGKAVGLRTRRAWIDEEAGFALTLLESNRSDSRVEG